MGRGAGVWLAGVVLSLGWTGACRADGEYFRYDRSEVAGYVGYHNASFGPQSDDLRIAGLAYGLRQDIGLREWLKLHLSFDSLRAQPEQASANPAYSLERSSYRVGLAPRIDAGRFVLALSLGAVQMRTDESRDGVRFFGDGRRSRIGFGIGGSSTVALGTDLKVHGEASGYSLSDIEILEASMRVSYRLRRQRAPRISLFAEGSECRYAKDAAELVESNLQFGVSYQL